MELKLVLSGEITIISLSGKLEVEKAQAFKSACLRSLSNKKVVFCMKNLSFVGSSGIQNFFGVLNDLNSHNQMHAKVAGLNQDFARLYQFSDCAHLEMYESIENAMQSF